MTYVGFQISFLATLVTYSCKILMSDHLRRHGEDQREGPVRVSDSKTSEFFDGETE
jgi:hypothetical protein